MAQRKYLDLAGLTAYTEKIKAWISNKFVAKESGKGLSTNDYTTAEKQKLAGLTNYIHPSGDGYKHVPANGTNNAGKVLTAGATAGVYTWEEPAAPTAITTEELDTICTGSLSVKVSPNMGLKIINDEGE